jgi:tetratricopeptide (TPR) repeat protein
LGLDVDDREWQELCDVALEGRDLALPGTTEQVVFLPEKAKIRAHLVDRLFDQGLAIESDLGWSFAHPMVRESLCRTCREDGTWEAQQLACARMLERRATRGLRGAGERIGLHLVAAGHGDEAIAHLMRGVQDRQVQRGYRSALTLLETCESTLEAARLEIEDERWGALWNLRSHLYFHHGDLGEAEFWAERAANAASQHGWHQVYRQGLFQMAQVSLRRSDLSRAEGRLMTLRAAATESGEDHLMLGKASFGLAAVARNRQQFDRAYQAYGEARGHFVQCGELTLAASCWRDMAAVELKCGDAAPAGELYRKALGLFESTGNLHDVAYCVNGLGEVARARGDLAKAEEHYRRALNIFEAVGASQINIPRLNLALIHLDRRDYEGARDLCQMAVRELERQGRRRLLGAAYMVMVPCDAGLKDWESWEVHFDAASQLLRETGFAEPDCAVAAQRAGDLASREGQHARSRRAYEFSLYQYLALGDEEGAARVQLLVHGS